MTCGDVHVSAAEFAFGLVVGVERARMVDHLESCSTCRQYLEELTSAADALLLSGPPIEPPPGFEQRVAQRLVVAPIPTARRHALRWVVVAAAVALVVFGGGVLLGRLAERTPEQAVRSASMQTPDGRTVGRVAVGADPDTVFVALPGWRPPDGGAKEESYQLRLTLGDGRSQLVGPVHLGSGDGSWGTVLAIDARRVRQVALVGEQGHAYCTGSFG